MFFKSHINLVCVSECSWVLLVVTLLRKPIVHRASIEMMNNAGCVTPHSITIFSHFFSFLREGKHILTLVSRAALPCLRTRLIPIQRVTRNNSGGRIKKSVYWKGGDEEVRKNIKEKSTSLSLFLDFAPLLSSHSRSIISLLWEALWAPVIQQNPTPLEVAISILTAKSVITREIELRKMFKCWNRDNHLGYFSIVIYHHPDKITLFIGDD